MCVVRQEQGPESGFRFKKPGNDQDDTLDPENYPLDRKKNPLDIKNDPLDPENYLLDRKNDPLEPGNDQDMRWFYQESGTGNW